MKSMNGKSTRTMSGAKATASRVVTAIQAAAARAQARGIDVESVAGIALGLVALGFIVVPALAPGLPSNGTPWLLGTGLIPRSNHNASPARDRR